MNNFKMKAMILLLSSGLFACSSNTEIPEEAFINEEPEAPIVVDKYREQTITHFEEHGRTFREPAGYRFSLSNDLPNRGQQDLKKDKKNLYLKPRPKKLSKKPTVVKVAQKDMNLWERYCSQGVLNEVELKHVLNNPVPEQYAKNCLPAK